MPVRYVHRLNPGIFWREVNTINVLWELQRDALDSSPNKVHLTNNNVYWAKDSSFFGHHYAKFGPGRYLTTSGNNPLLRPNLPFTWLFWFKMPRDIDPGGVSAINNYSYTSNPSIYYGYDIHLGHFTTLRGYVRVVIGQGGSTNFVVNSQREYNDTRWHLCVIVLDINLVQIYIDGVLDNRVSSTYNLAYATNSTFNLGRFMTDNQTFLYDGLAYVTLFKRVLKSDEILEYYRWATSSPKKYWYFASPPPLQIPSTRRLIIAST